MFICINAHIKQGSLGLFSSLFMSFGKKTHFLRRELRQPYFKKRQDPYIKEVPVCQNIKNVVSVCRNMLILSFSM